MRPHDGMALDDDGEQRVQGALRRLADRYPPLSDAELVGMAHRATAAPRLASRSGWTPRRLVLLAAVIVAVVAVGTPVLASVIDRLQQTAQRTGVREVAPQTTTAGYTPAPVPYLSVQPLMRYVGSSLPIVPSAAITERDGQRVVFVLAGIPNELPSGHDQVTVRATPITLGTHYGKAVAVSSGVSPCDQVVVDPPGSLHSGDRIPTYVGGSEESLNTDYRNLFAGRSPAPPPAIEGGIARDNGDGTLVLAFASHRRAPEGASYLYRAPDGTTRRVAYKASADAEVQVAKSALRIGQPLGTVQLLSPSGTVLAAGTLDWYCTP